MQEVTATLAAAKDVSTDAGVAAILSKMGAIFTLQEKKKKSTEGFSQLAISNTHLTAHSNEPQGGHMQLMPPVKPIEKP